MTTPELPPQQWLCVAPTPDGRLISLASEESVEPRERILMQRIAELQNEADRRTREVEATYLVQKRLNERIAELSDAAQEVIDCLPHRHDVSLARLRAAIDAARGAK